MDARSREQIREEISQRRFKPKAPQRLFFPASGMGECTAEIDAERPMELCIEATAAEGTLSPWLCDEWWIHIQAALKRQAVTIIILPTPGALLNEVVLHQLCMIRRVSPEWYIIGYALAADAQREPDSQRWLNTPFDEIRFCADEIQSHNSPGETAQKLVSSAGDAPLTPGYHQARVRLIEALPRAHQTVNG